MGKIYQSIASYMPENPTGVFVEIGSERGEGSTISLNSLAKDRKSTRLNSSHVKRSRMPSSA